ncbi:MAG: agmatinase family protein [Chitinophagales bacterium]
MQSKDKINPSKLEKIATFNPNSVGLLNGNLYGLPFTYEESDIIVIPVPWEVTVSYQAGTAKAPQAILDASSQLDLYDFDVPDFWKKGIYMLPISEYWQQKNETLRQQAKRYIDFLENGGNVEDNAKMKAILEAINKVNFELKEFVKQNAQKILNDNKLAIVLGGEHSVPLGLLEALAEKHESFGMLQIDAHADLHEAFEGFKLSHASIMHNALKIEQLSKIVSVGIRDICHAEIEVIKQSENRIKAFFDDEIKEQVQIKQIETWHSLCEKIVEQLPQKLYISFDIDGLDPKLCPNTGTPVSGGLSFHEATYLIKQVVKSGREIIGFDLCETGFSKNTDWDANVGARVLYKLAALSSFKK